MKVLQQNHDECVQHLVKYLLVKLAPVILGEKPAGLLRLTNCRFRHGRRFDTFCRRHREIPQTLGLAHRILKANKGNLIVLFYRPERLTAYLARPECEAFLAAAGYHPGSEVDQLVEHCAATRDFPHEIGVFLGYPLKDVKGFMEDSSRCQVIPRGMWRVAGDPGESLALMERFRQAEIWMKKITERCLSYEIMLEAVRRKSSVA